MIILLFLYLFIFIIFWGWMQSVAHRLDLLVLRLSHHFVDPLSVFSQLCWTFLQTLDPLFLPSTLSKLLNPTANYFRFGGGGCQWLFYSSFQEHGRVFQHSEWCLCVLLKKQIKITQQWYKTRNKTQHHTHLLSLYKYWQSILSKLAINTVNNLRRTWN